VILGPQRTAWEAHPPPRTKCLPQAQNMGARLHGLWVPSARPQPRAMGLGTTFIAADDDRDDGRAIRGRHWTRCPMPHRPAFAPGAFKTCKEDGHHRLETGVTASNHLLWGMRFQVEFLHHSNEHADGIVIRRNSGQFAGERDVEIYAITRRPEDADGFRILRDGVVRKTVSIQTEK
jgi:hypothetical protein